MSISDKRLLANRVNGAKSRGPVTVRGKINSQRANLRHGLLSQTLVLGNESQDRFNQIVTELRREFSPQTTTEFTLIEKMAACYWRQTRIWALEKAAYTREMRRQLGLTPTLADEDDATQTEIAFTHLVDHSISLETLSRYEVRFDRQYNRALHRLQHIQERRERKTQAQMQHAA